MMAGGINTSAVSLEINGGSPFLFTSESVGEGHPDKICDQIADAILDACLREDKNSKVAVEVVTKTGLIFIFGEISTRANLDFQKIAREVIKDIGYDDSRKGFDYKTCNVMVSVEEQSPDIAQGIHGEDRNIIGAGDQGMMFGYATDETEERIPLSLLLSHRLVLRLAECRKNTDSKDHLSWLRPDCKSQVTLEYVSFNGRVIPQRIHAVVISFQHAEPFDMDKMRAEIMEKVVFHVLPGYMIDSRTTFYIQPAGKFVIGGPQGDSGLTGRKVIVDTYGGWGAHGGGSFSGKDWSKVDRSGSYMARWIAKSLVDAGICRRVLVQLSYAIGISDPVSINIDTYGSNVYPYTTSDIIEIVRQNFNLRPGRIVEELGLDMPIYRGTSCYGHFGRKGFSWEVSRKLCLTQEDTNTTRDSQ